MDGDRHAVRQVTVQLPAGVGRPGGLLHGTNGQSPPWLDDRAGQVHLDLPTIIPVLDDMNLGAGPLGSGDPGD